MFLRLIGIETDSSGFENWSLLLGSLEQMIDQHQQVDIWGKGVFFIKLGTRRFLARPVKGWCDVQEPFFMQDYSLSECKSLSIPQNWQSFSFQEILEEQLNSSSIAEGMPSRLIELANEQQSDRSYRVMLKSWDVKAI